jgi:hypothetical protein
MNFFQISDSAGGVTVKTVIHIGSVRGCQNGCYFQVDCTHGVKFDAYAICESPQADKAELAANRAWLEGRRQSLIDAINAET